MRAPFGVTEALIALMPIRSEDVRRQQGALSVRAHRPWPLPDRPWMLAQTWHDTLFAHWPAPYEAMREIVPATIPLDTFDGRAWIGVTPFEVSGFRMRGTIPVPVVSRFPELNVRTYVSLDGKPGIYFLSLDADSRVSVLGARRSHRLPYFRSQMSVRRDRGWVQYESHRPDSAAGFEGRYRGVGEQFYAERGTLAHWLTERYCLYTVDERHRVFRGDIHHGPWLLRGAEAAIELNMITEPYGIELEGEPVLHYSARQDTLMWGLGEQRPQNS
jgi:uncharacterized protein YqjF (DUF2071 family)